ncbi:hypothetical protein SACS_0162 [Parasaccharibacter apium]|uniref:Uncharacterized protein n=1 Tax=Parasaccharibacter apium TaxID=1510841 RepID=A0A7U7IZS5_9PROT|nr:hypothetical protein SACS_0162 [Parasaccharibacter apium]
MVSGIRYDQDDALHGKRGKQGTRKSDLWRVEYAAGYVL